MTAEGVKADSEFSPELASGEQALVVDVEGFEGPLDPNRHRGQLGGWKSKGLPWAQG